MKKTAGILFAIFLTGFAICQNNDLQNTIRQKIENRTNGEIYSAGEILYCKSSLAQFYQYRGFQPVWNPMMANQLLVSISKVDQEGLNPNDYHYKTLKELSNNAGGVLAGADLELLLSDAYLLLASHLISGKVDPITIDPEWHVVRRESNPVEIFSKAIESGKIGRSLKELLPKHQTYSGLKTAFKKYSAYNANSWDNIPEGETLKKGMENSRVAMIRQRLILTGDLAANESELGNIYDETLFEAVKQFQKRHGLDDDGDVGQKTIKALNISLDDRIDQLRANLERWRWMPQEFGDYYLKVNIASFELEVMKNGKIERIHKIIVGKPFRKTPVFSSKMQYLVLNPTWTIPPGILNNDIIPAVRKDPGYLAKKNISVLDNSGNPIDQSLIDWKSSSVKGYTYRQSAGPDNALGAVKFMFPNQFHVYLHDTPSKELFAKSERAFSSGCIRVKDPLDLAMYILNDPAWTMDKINQVVATKKTQTIALKEQPNVYLLYWTAWTDTNGVIQFRNDIYDRDDTLIKALNQKPPRTTY